jgi:hypothetical protein
MGTLYVACVLAPRRESDWYHGDAPLGCRPRLRTGMILAIVNRSGFATTSFVTSPAP